MLDMLLAIAVLVLLTYWLASTVFYWSRRGAIFSLFPLPFFGNFLPSLFLSSKEFFDYLYYKNVRAPYIGIHLFTRPALFLRDPEMVSEVLEDKAPYFGSHGVYTNPKRDPIGRSLFHISGIEWKQARSKISPQFSPAKVKSFMELGKQSIKKLVEELEDQLVDDGENKGVELELQSRAMFLTIDFTAASIFGIDSKVFTDGKESEFYISAKALNPPSSMFKVLLGMLSPRLYDLLRTTSFSKSASDFVDAMLDSSISSRTNSVGTTRVLMDGLIDLMKKHKEFDKGFVKSQGMVLWAGGVETTAVTLSFALYELAANQSLQDDIRASLKTDRGKDLLKGVINETLRKYPVFGMLTRECTLGCQLSNGLVTKPGDLLIIPALSLHWDPTNFPEPQQFRVDREFRKGAYVPFGAGPRTCLGMRLGMSILHETLEGLLEAFEFRPGHLPMILEPNTFFTSPKDGIWLNVRRCTVQNLIPSSL